MSELAHTEASRIHVVFYADFRKAAGVKEIDIVLDERIPVRQLLTMIAHQLPALRRVVDAVLTQQEAGGHVLVLVGSKIANLETMISPGERVQVMPPISGG